MRQSGDEREVATIKRGKDHAEIIYKDSNIAGTHLHIGPQVQEMSHEEILDVHNRILATQEEMRAAYHQIAVEVPEGRPQIRYFKGGDQWVPRGDVLRCVVNDGGPDGEAEVYIDDHELSLDEFGRLLRSYAGWGMRITFVPEDDIGRLPTIEVREPDDDG